MCVVARTFSGVAGSCVLNTSYPRHTLRPSRSERASKGHARCARWFDQAMGVKPGVALRTDYRGHEHYQLVYSCTIRKHSRAALQSGMHGCPWRWEVRGGGGRGEKVQRVSLAVSKKGSAFGAPRKDLWGCLCDGHQKVCTGARLLTARFEQRIIIVHPLCSTM